MLPSIANTATLIRAGWDPWRLLNEFFHAWYDYHRDSREALIAEPIVFPDVEWKSVDQWALLCVAVVEYLCAESNIARPAWVIACSLSLPKSWYPEENNELNPVIRRNAQLTTPDVLRKRNIWCSERLFYTKYHWAKMSYSSTQPAG